MVGEASGQPPQWHKWLKCPHLVRTRNQIESESETNLNGMALKFTADSSQVDEEKNCNADNSGEVKFGSWEIGAKIKINIKVERLKGDRNYVTTWSRQRTRAVDLVGNSTTIICNYKSSFSSETYNKRNGLLTAPTLLSDRIMLFLQIGRCRIGRV